MRIFVGLYFGKEVYVDNQDAADFIEATWRETQRMEMQHAEDLKHLLE